jgi:hypothetical protein
MYNFRYHLITICAIFIALAVGLLLGAAIAGSDLVRDTSNDMVDSLLARFDETEGINTQLTNDLAFERGFSAVLQDGWESDRLSGRTIIVLADEQTTGSGLTETMISIINHAGGNPVTITMLKPGFGAAEEQTATQLQEVLPAVEGTEYATTLVEALAAEWSTPVANLAELQTSASTVPSNPAGEEATPNGEAPAVTPADAAAQAAAALEATVPPSSNTGITPGNDFERALYARYPVTMQLISLDCITIAANYDTFITQAEEKNAPLHLQLYTALDAWQLPYASNGIVAIALDRSQDAPAPAPAALALAQQFMAKGNDGNLPYPAIFDTPANGAPTVLGAETTLNYFALLAQEDDASNAFVEAARQTGLSCVTTPRTRSGSYSTVALLSGAERGIYGEDQGEGALYPALPPDHSGLDPFT